MPEKMSRWIDTVHIYKVEDARVYINTKSRRIRITPKGESVFSFIEQIDKNVRLRRTICPYRVKVFKQTEHKDEYFKWIDENTTGYWYQIQGYYFCFENEADAVAFKLRW